MIRNATSSQSSEKSRVFGKLRGVGLATLAALTIAGTSMLTAAPAQARDWHHHDRGGAVAAGVIGGLALGAIAGSAIAQPAPTVIYEDDDYPVEYRRVYRPRRDLPSCSNFRRVDWDARVWIDDYGRAHPCY